MLLWELQLLLLLLLHLHLLLLLDLLLLHWKGWPCHLGRCCRTELH
jgi:hypothetical protein